MMRLCTRGHEVTLFTSGFPGCKSEETIDGIRVVRQGDRLSVYRKARRYYNGLSERFEVVIDEINTVPFMTPRFVDRGEKIIALIHQLAREFWFYEMPYPVAWLGYHYLEERWLKRYRDILTITVSDSTKEELANLGFKDIRVVPNGLNVSTLDSVPIKTAEPSLVYVGRLKKAKKPEDALEAFRLLKEKRPSVQMTVVGDGYLKQGLQEKYPDAKFTGYLDRASRDAVVSKSWALAVPGVREGWGQVVTDSNALGTPAVGYNIPGLRDSIRDEFNGSLVEPNPAALADGLERLLSDEDRRSRLSKNALEWSRRFSWDRSTDSFESLLH